MKTKIAVVFTVVLSALLVSDVYAYQAYEGTFYEAEKIEGVYFYQHRNNPDTKNYQYNDCHRQATIYRKTTDNNVVYSIESLEPIDGASNGSHLITNREYPDSWESAVAARIEALAYYGYGYKEDGYDHTDPKWYAVTQYLIWTASSSDIRYHFTSSISSTTPTYPFEYEIGELIYLTDQHFKTPFFEDYENKKHLEVGKRIILKDLQNAMYSYQKIESPTLNVEKTRYNELTITAPTEGEHNLYLLKSYNYYDRPLTYYRSNEYQDMLERGNIPLKKETYSFTAETPEGSITIPEKTDEENVSKEDINKLPTDETSSDQDNKDDTPSSDKTEETGDTENKEETPPESDDKTPDNTDEEVDKEDDKNPPSDETPSDQDNKEDTTSSDKTENTGDLENKEETPPVSDDKTPDNKDEEEDKKDDKGDKNPPIDETPSDQDNKEDTTSSDKTEDTGDLENKVETPPINDNKTEDNEDDNKPSKDDTQNTPDNKVESIPSLSENENNNKKEENVLDKPNINDTDENTSVETNKEEDNQDEKGNNSNIPNEFLDDKKDSKDNEDLLNKELVDKLENYYEPIEVEVPATDASVLSILFYFLSIFGLLFIRHAK